MAVEKLAIHVLPDSNPSNVSDLIYQLARTPDLSFKTNRELVEFMKNSGSKSNEWMASTATKMGILSRTDHGPIITPTGIALARASRAILGDLLHFLLFTGWSEDEPFQFLQSWSYRQICERYWQQGRVGLSTEYKNRVASDITADALEWFSKYGDYSSASFGLKSIKGAHDWLAALRPPVLEGSTFTRRTFCPPELLVLAFGYVLRNEEGATEFDTLLSPGIRTAICQACLLDPVNLDKTLDWAMSVFPDLISPGTSAGSYGRFVRLHKLPTIEDIVR